MTQVRQERQVNFSAGELSPSLWGRTDLEAYAAGARTLKNFLVTPHGTILNRSGTQMAGTGAEEITSGSFIRLVPFIVSDTDAVLLVFLSTGQVIVVKTDDEDPRHGWENPVAFQSPYDSEEKLRNLRWAQYGNVLTLVCEDVRPRELRRVNTDNTEWEFRTLDFSRIPYPLSLDVATEISAGEAGETWPRINYSSEVFFRAEDDAHPQREWDWKHTYVVREIDTGRTFETAPHTIDQIYLEAWTPGGTTDAEDGYQGEDINPDIESGDSGYFPFTPGEAEFVVFSDLPKAIAIPLAEGDSYVNDDDRETEYVVMFSRVYRGRDGRFGLLGQTDGNTFIDYGDTPEFNNPPPREFNPFRIEDADGDFLRWENPRACAFFEGRRYFASTEERPSHVWASKVDQWDNFDEVILADADDALTFETASNRAERIQALIPWRSLVLLTSAAERVVQGSGPESPITPDNIIRSLPVSKVGAAFSPPPLEVDSTVFFAQALGVSPVAMTIDGERAGTARIGTLSKHLFSGYTIKDWAFAEEPYAVLWVVRSDGALLSCTWLPEQGMAAWAHHEISGDAVVESIATIPEWREHGVYLTVNRDGTRSLERLAYRHLTDIRQAVFLDRAVTWNGRWINPEGETEAADVDAFVLSGSDTATGDTVTVGFVGDEGSEDSKVGMTIIIDDPDGGRPYLINLLSRDAPNDEYDAQVLGRDVEDIIGVTIEGTDWYEARQGVSGLGHLEGESVVAVADGSVVTGLTVNGGGVSIGFWAGVIHVGLAFNSDFESLDAAQDRERVKIVREIGLELEYARGGSAGSSLDDLTDVPTRVVADDYSYMTGKREEYALHIEDAWDTRGRVAFRQSQPLPVEVLGIRREIAYGG